MRAVIVDEWPVLRHGLRVVLGEHGVRTVGLLPTAAEGLTRAGEGGVDLVVAGRTADMGHDKVVRRVTRLAHPVRAVVLLGTSDRVDPVALLSLGAAAVLPRTVGERELADAVARLKAGDRYLAPSVLAAAYGSNGPSVRDDEGALTSRERAVLGHLVHGSTNREIAQALFVGQETVKTHLRNIYAKLEVTGRHQAVGRAVELGLVG